MEPLLYVIAILGCGDGAAPCEEVQIAPGHYASQAACARATEAMLVRHSKLDFPVIVAQCRPAAGAFQPPRGDEIELPEPEPNPHFSVG